VLIMTDREHDVVRRLGTGDLAEARWRPIAVP
jgi:hypothetical protein